MLYPSDAIFVHSNRSDALLVKFLKKIVVVSKMPRRINHNNSMRMIRHHYKLVQRNVRKMIWNNSPVFPYLFSNRRQIHFAIDHFAEVMLSFTSADSNEICPFTIIVPRGKSWGSSIFILKSSHEFSIGMANVK